MARVGEPAQAVVSYTDALMSLVEATVTIGPRNARQIRDVAIASRLRAADAAYLWLGARKSLPLCTLDKEMLVRGQGSCDTMLP